MLFKTLSGAMVNHYRKQPNTRRRLRMLTDAVTNTIRAVPKFQTGTVCTVWSTQSVTLSWSVNAILISLSA